MQTGVTPHIRSQPNHTASGTIAAYASSAELPREKMVHGAFAFSRVHAVWTSGLEKRNQRRMRSAGVSEGTRRPLARSSVNCPFKEEHGVSSSTADHRMSDQPL
ncbi:hypothetical protein ZHAS_00009751 [Anopheles sinensis]|uniref:Uncharacterized protein n=1 Tax=Anopheles sinensis TaxID=74873 RepID=A0A084VVU8_ANOSI|nr:hypothetical protein ZHAS_00009751 [Anopheles sinensis]